MAFIVAEVTPLFLVTCFTVIAYDLDAIDQVIWVIVAPYIATGAIAPFVGSLSDLLGRKGIILTSLAMGIVSFILLGAAPNFAVFLVGQVISGMAIGIQLLTIIAAASELVPVAKRGATIGYIVIGFFPFAAASLYGQLIASVNWRWIFLLIGIWSAMSFVVLAIWYNPPPQPASVGLSKGELLKRIDYIGCTLSILGVVLFLVGINWGGQTYPWKSVQVICMLVFGVVTLIIFGIYERFFCKCPMFPARLVQNKRHFIAVSVLCLTSGVNYVPLTVFWTIQTYSVYGASFAQAGVWLLPLGFCIAGGAIISAILITVFKRHIQWVLLVFCIIQTVGKSLQSSRLLGNTLTVIGIACMSLFDRNDISTVWGPMIFGLIGVGAVLLPSQVVFSVISPPDLIGTSVALSVVIRMIGQVVGKSMFYNIFKQRLTAEAPAIIGLPAVSVGFSDIPRITKLVTTMTAGPLSHYRALFPELDSPQDLSLIIEAGQQLYAKVFPLLYLVSIPFGVLACLSCLALWGIDKYMDGDVAVHL